MSDNKSLMQQVQAFFQANAVLSPMVSGVQLLGLLQGAHAAGILDAALNPSTPGQIASAVGLDENRVVNICYALDAHEIFLEEGGHYRLADPWVTLIAPDAIQLFQVQVEFAFAQRKALLIGITDRDNYWTMSSEERVALAKGGVFNPASPYTVAVLKAMVEENFPAVHAILAAGGRYLELGCGAAGAMLSWLQAYLAMTAVGIELASDIVEEARQQAQVVGVSDGVVFYQDDVRNFQERDAFDCVTWSEPFFPPDTRAAALQVAFRALKPGGFLIVPLLSDPSILMENLHSQEGRSYSLNRVVFDGWGLPAMSGEAVQHEIEAAGFIEAKLFPTPSLRIILAQRPKDS